MTRAESTSSAGHGVSVLTSSDGIRSPFLEHAETRQRLERAQEQKSRTQHELNTLVRVRSITPHMSPCELVKKDEEINGLKNQLNAMNLQIQQFSAQLHQAEVTIRQQQATIRTQSKQIERPSQTAGSMSEPRVAPLQNHFSHSRFEPPPSFDTQGALTQRPQIEAKHQYEPTRSTWGPPASGHARPANIFASAEVKDVNSMRTESYTGSRLHSVNSDGSPISHHHRLLTTPTHRADTSSSSSGWGGIQFSCDDPFTRPTTMGVQSPPASSPRDPRGHNSPYHSRVAKKDDDDLRPSSSGEDKSQRPISALLPPSTDWSIDQDVSDGVERLFVMAKDYALCHSNFANTAGDSALPTDLKERLLKACGQKNAFKVLKTPDTRYMLVVRIMLQWIVKHIFRSNTFGGLDFNADKAIESTKVSIYQSTPAALRYLMLSTVANHVKTITSHSRFFEHVESLIKQRSVALYWLVRPMAHQPTNRDETDMIDIVRQAHRVALLMYSSADEYRFDFGEVEMRFDGLRMHNIDPVYGSCSNEEMWGRHALVRLCTTPEVNVRKNNSQGNGNEVHMHKARVLLKLRGYEN